MAWFNAKPRAPEVPGAVSSQGKQQDRTRAQEIVARGGTPLMPDIDGAEYLVDYWQDLGMAQSEGGVPTPLSATEIAAWQQSTGNELQPWEFHILREMSRAYLRQLHESEKPECPPPYGDPTALIDRETVGKKVASAFKSMIQQKRK